MSLMSCYSPDMMFKITDFKWSKLDLVALNRTKPKNYILTLLEYYPLKVYLAFNKILGFPLVLEELEK